MNTFFRFLGSLVTLGLGGIPAWIFLAVKHAVNPVGFWQNVALYGLGFYFLCAWQVVFLIGAIVVIVAIWMIGR